MGCRLMLRRPDPEPSTQRALAWLGSAISQPPVPVATWTHTHQTRWTSKHRPSPTARPKASPLKPTSIFWIRGSPSYGAKGCGYGKIWASENTTSLMFPPEKEASLNMTQHIWNSQEKETHLQRSSSTQTQKALCRMVPAHTLPFHVTTAMWQQTSHPEFRPELGPTFLSHTAT